MTTLIENPVPILFTGIVTVAILAVLFFNTQRGVFLLAIGGVVLLTLLGLGVEHLIVTDREQVEAALYGLADAMEANDAKAVLNHLSPSVNPQTRSRADEALARYTIKETAVSNLRIDVNNLTSPPSARARFRGRIRASDRKGELPYESALLDITIDYHKEGDRWLITGHQEKWANLGGPSD